MALTPQDFLQSFVGLITGGPIGAIASPAVGRAVKGKWGPWALIGVFAGPVSWLAFTVPVAVLTFDPSKAPNPPAALETPAGDTTDPDQVPEPHALPSEDQDANAPSTPNTTISDNLNAADGLFKNDMDGCSNVSLAISAANNPQLFGQPTEEQRSELRNYAARCGLRY